jgi:RNA polymerase sigma-70 factor (ECF subfamily)
MGFNQNDTNVVCPVAFHREPEDAVLVEAALRRDAVACTRLFNRYAPHVARVFARVLGTDDEIPDLVHDVFVMAFRDLGRLSEPSALKAWLTAIAVNTARGHIRKRTRRRWLWFFAPSDLPDTPGPSANEDILEATRATYAILDQLAPDDRIAFALRFIDGMELTEVADACDVSLATIKRRLARAEVAFAERARTYPALQSWMEGSGRWATS